MGRPGAVAVSVLLQRLPRGGALALHDGTRQWCHDELHDEIEAWHRRLRERGIARGLAFGWLGLNSLSMLATLFACAKLHARFVPLNWRLAAPELRAIAAHAQLAAWHADATLRRTRRRRAVGRAAAHQPRRSAARLHQRHHRRAEGSAAHAGGDGGQHRRRDRRTGLGCEHAHAGRAAAVSRRRFVHPSLADAGRRRCRQAAAAIRCRRVARRRGGVAPDDEPARAGRHARVGRASALVRGRPDVAAFRQQRFADRAARADRSLSRAWRAGGAGLWRH